MDPFRAEPEVDTARAFVKEVSDSALSDFRVWSLEQLRSVGPQVQSLSFEPDI